MLWSVGGLLPNLILTNNGILEENERSPDFLGL
jgi:hypothetical protein